MTKQRPNILWYCTDQQRFDTIHALGNAHISTPNLDRLVDHGVAFENAYVQSPICTPSRASFLTGRYPASTHVHRNGNARFADSEVLMTRLLADAGYDCGLIGKLHLSSASEGREIRPDDGYRVVHYSHHPMPDTDIDANDYLIWLRDEKGIDPNELYAPVKGFCCNGVPAEYHQTTWCTEMAIRFIDEPRDGPWMLSINPFDPHPPFDPPTNYLDRYNADDIPPPLFRPGDIDRYEKVRQVCQQARQAVDPTIRQSHEGADTDSPATRPPDQFDGRKVKAAYYAMVELLDEQFGRLVDYLEERGELENTLILFHSDHGEMLGDHGLLYKGCRFFEGLVHVPMIMSWQGKFLAGERSSALVELVDIAPTLLDAAGLEIPSSMQGKSLQAMLAGEVPTDHHKDFVVSEFNDAIRPNDDTGPTHGTMVFDGRYKSIVYHGLGIGEIYDLESDPGEFDDLWDEPGGLALKAKLLHRHLDAVAATSSAGIERVSKF